MIKGSQKQEMQRKLRVLAEEEERQKEIKDKLKLVTKQVRDLLKNATQKNEPNLNSTLSAFNTEFMPKIIYNLEAKTQHLKDSQESLKTEQQRIRRDKLMIFEEKQKYEHGIKNYKETIVRIQKAIDESVEEETQKRKKIEDDLDNSIKEIKEKIETFKQQTIDFDKENQELRQKKQEILAKINNMETDFKKKAQEKDQSVKEDREKLLGDLKQVQQQVNVATQMSKKFSELQKQNFDNRMAIYLKVKKFPQTINSFQNSAHTIDQCKQQLFIGVDRLNKAISTIKESEKQRDEIKQKFIIKLKEHTQRQQKVNLLKKQKEQIKGRILELQTKKKQKQAQEASQ